MGLALPIIDTQRRGIAFGPQWPCDSCDVGSRLQMVLTGVTLFVCHQAVDTLQDTLFGKCHRLRKDLTSCSAEAPVPQHFSRVGRDSRGPRLRLVRTTFLVVTTPTATFLQNHCTTRLFKRGLWSILVFSREENWSGGARSIRET